VGLATSGVGQTYDLADWRQDVRVRRDAARVIVQRVAQGRENAERVFDEFRRAIRYDYMSEKDQNLVRQNIHAMRTIINNWNLMDEREKERFLNGKIVPSTLAKELRSRV